jgi:hypothetical protein
VRGSALAASSLLAERDVAGLDHVLEDDAAAALRGSGLKTGL